jgi:uncharacterized protein (DUF2236 family)
MAASPLRDDEELLERAGIDSLPEGAEGLFRADSWIRRVSGESVTLFGGGRALLLEVAHPLVAAGVADHSNFRTDPFGRLQRTLDALNAVVFGDRARALAAARGVERAHDRVHGNLAEAAGPFPAGTPYHGRDPELMRWVWATLADTARAVYERFVEPLDPAAIAAYEADHRVVARVLGVPRELLPPDPAAFRRYFDGMLEGGTLAVSSQGRAIAEAVLHPPVPLAGGGMMRLVTAGLLPASLRRAFGLPWDDARAARLEALTASVRGLRRS